MIKKINVALVVVFLAMFGLKALVELRKSRPTAVVETPAAEAEGVSDLSPTVYYHKWNPYNWDNPISQHRGFLLDQVVAIFPRARLVCVDNYPPDETPLTMLTKDPSAVAVEYGAAINTNGYPMSETPLGWYRVCVFTRRDNPWRYKGAKSLEQISIVCDSEYLDCAEIRDMQKRGAGRIEVCSRPDANVWMAVADGKYDACLGTYANNYLRQANSSYEILQNFRRSDPIGKVHLPLIVSNLDTNFAARVIREYEEGMKRIKETGVRRRICEYYGFSEK